MIIKKNGEQIRSFDDWFRLAPPTRGIKHWADGRSAKVLAQAWFPVAGDPTVPKEIEHLLASSEILGHIKLIEGEPESRVRFDNIY